MSEPGLQPAALTQARQDGLWDKAPAWRTLTIAASLLTLAAVAVPVLLPPPAETGSVKRPASPQLAAAAPNPSAPPHVSPTPAVTPQANATPPAAILRPPAAHDAPPPVRTASLPAHPEAAPIPETATLPDHAAAQPQVACGITIGTQVLPMGGGIVTGYEGALAAQRRVAGNEANIGGPINPAFANTPRAIVQPDGNGQRQIVVVPPGMTVGIGDHVTFNGIHRDAGMPCGYVPPLITSDSPAGKPADHAAGAPSSQIASLPPPSASTALPAGATASTAADLPVGTIVVSPGVMALVNRHNQWGNGHDYPITITIISPPAHGTVTTQGGTAPVTYSNGITRISPITRVFYKSAPGYTGMDTFTYKRTSEDPSDPRNANTYTMTIDVK